LLVVVGGGVGEWVGGWVRATTAVVVQSKENGRE
jgi:hypothetical protein